MTPSNRLPLALTLALPLLACDQPDSGGREESRSASISAVQGATVRLGVELEPVRVTSYSIGGALAEALSEQGFEALLSGARTGSEDGLLVLRLDGVALPRPANIDEAFVEVHRDDEVLAYPYKQFKFQVNIDSDGRPTTDLVLHAAYEDGDFALWHDPLGSAPPPPVPPVETIEYELVTADGTSTTCRSETAPVDQLSFGFTPIKASTGSFAFDIADDCADVLEAAADDNPPNAFFVRCDPTTTTASIGTHKLSDVTLKRGVISATAEVEIEHWTQ